MDFSQAALSLSQFFAIISVFPYLYGIFSKRVVPNRISWSIITLVGTVNFLAIVTSSHMELSSKLFSGVLALNPFLILLASLFFGESQRVTLFEKIAAVLAVCSLAVWWFTRDMSVLFALSVGILADIFGILPTIVFIRENPDKDRPTAWCLFVISSIFTILALESITLESIILPLYMILSSGSVVYFLVRYRLGKSLPISEWL